MNLALSDEQRMLQEAARDALSRLNTVESARAALDGEPLVDLWPTAVQAGWTGLLIAEDAGGAGLAPFDAMLVLEECGRRLTGAGLIGHFMATHALSVAGHPDLEALASGQARGALVAADPKDWSVESTDGQGRVAAPILSGGVLTGRAGFVIDAADADVVVVVATEDGEPILAIAGNPTIEPVVRYDATRPLGHVLLDDTPATVIARGPQAPVAAWFLGQALLAADALGICQTCLDTGIAYAMERQTFGRPIGSYQAVKHQLVEILRRLDSTRNLLYFAGLAAEHQPEDLSLAASCARFTGEDAADYATRTCIAVHGGIGATWEHDAPFYWRRSQLSRLLLGGASGAGDRVAADILARARDLVAA